MGSGYGSKNYAGSLKIRFKVEGGGGVHKKLIYRENSLRRGQGGLRGGGLGEKRGWCF